MKKLLLALAAVSTLALAACRTDPVEQVAIVETYGFTEVQMTGYAWFGCPESDDVRAEFTATSPTGQRVKGVFCSGFTEFDRGASVRVTGLVR